jgi:hypothetical protein
MGYEDDMRDWYDELHQKKIDEENNLLHQRNKFELWVDKYNHTLEFTRTIVQILVFVLQIIVLWKLFS